MLRCALPGCLALVLIAPGALGQPDGGGTLLGYDPAAAATNVYRLDVASVVDSPFGNGLALDGFVIIHHTPQPPDARGLVEVLMSIPDGEIHVIGKTLDFATKAYAWNWYMDRRLQFVNTEDSQPLTGYLVFLEPFFRAAFTIELPAEAKAEGDSWEVSTPQQHGSEGSFVHTSSYTLAALEQDEQGRTIAAIEGDVDIPVEIDFVGSLFYGSISGHMSMRLLANTGQLVSMHGEGGARFEEDRGLTITMRDLTMDLAWQSSAEGMQREQWSQIRRAGGSFSGGSLTEAIITANVSDYLRDDWRLPVPLNRDPSSPLGEWMPGLTLIGRYNEDFLYQFGGGWDSRYRHGVGTLSITHGYPIQPTNQYKLDYVNRGGRSYLELGWDHYWGRRLGPTSTPRNRFTTEVRFDDLVPLAGALGTVGQANAVSVGYTRFRTGESEVGFHALDWGLDTQLDVGVPAFGGRYGFVRSDSRVGAFYQHGGYQSWAARLRATFSGGNVPDQYRTSLADGTVLRGYDEWAAPLANHSITGSLEYRVPIPKFRFLHDLSVREWWLGFHLDAGIGGNTLAQLRRSPLYVDAGVTVRARADYFDIPMDVYGSLTWPLTVGRSAVPDLSIGLDWAF